MKAITIFIIIALGVIGLVIAETSSSSINWVGHGYLRANYCKLFGDCTYANLTVTENATIYDSIKDNESNARIYFEYGSIVNEI